MGRNYSVRRTGCSEPVRGKRAVIDAIHEESASMHQERGAAVSGVMANAWHMEEDGLPLLTPRAVIDARDELEAEQAGATSRSRQQAAASAGDAWQQWRAEDAEMTALDALDADESRRFAIALRELMEQELSDDAFDEGLRRYREQQGVGIGGFKGIWIAKASAGTREMYKGLIRRVAVDVRMAAHELELATTPEKRRAAKEAVRAAAPAGWTRWPVILLKKPGKALDVLCKRRDIYLQPHSLKLFMNSCSPTYDAAQRAAQPVANTGFRPKGSAPQAALAIGLAREEAVSERKSWYRGYCDKGGFFQSIVRRLQRACEARCGVAPDVTETVIALHESLVVAYDSGHGMTPGRESDTGNGQGDSKGTSRSMVPLAFETRALEWLVAGCEFRVPHGVQRARTPQAWFADDGAIETDAFSTLQVAFTVMSATARALGFDVGIDTDADGTPNGDKTGWAAAEWDGTKYVEAGEGGSIELIDGRTVPRVKGWYKHLGIRAQNTCGWAEARGAVIARCTGIAAATARLGVLSADDYIDTVDVVTLSVVQYYGAAFPIGRAACERIDTAKRQGLRKLGHMGPRATRWLVHTPRPEGLGMAVTYAHAAAALVVEVDNAYNANPHLPVHAAAAARTSRQYWTYGWRPSADAPAPLAWNPWHVTRALVEEGIIEAALGYRLLAGIETRMAAGNGAENTLADRYVLGVEQADALLWEVPGRTWGPRLARLGVVSRRHLYGGEWPVIDEESGEVTVQGRWRSAAELGELCGRGGEVRDGVRRGARLTQEERNEYTMLLDSMTAEEEEWVRKQRGPPMQRPREREVVAVDDAGQGRTGRPEYWMTWSDGAMGWGERPRGATREVVRQIRAVAEARADAVARGEDETNAREYLRRTRDDAWLWLATQAPLAVGARDAEAVLREAQDAGVPTARKEIGHALEQGPDAPAAMVQRSAEEALRETTWMESMMRASTEAEARGGWLGTDEAVGAAMAAEVAEAASARAAAHSAAAQAATATSKEGELEQDRRRRRAAQADAEWVAARARLAAGELLLAVTAWAQRRPEYGAASTGNVEGPGAAEEHIRRAHPTSFVPSARVVHFPGQLENEEEAETSETGGGARAGRKLRPTLALDATAEAAARRLPLSMQPPGDADAHNDARVAWNDEERMWTGAAPPLTPEQQARAEMSCRRARERLAERRQQEERARRRSAEGATAQGAGQGMTPEEAGGTSAEAGGDEAAGGQRRQPSAAQREHMELGEAARDACAEARAIEYEPTADEEDEARELEQAAAAQQHADEAQRFAEVMEQEEEIERDMEAALHDETDRTAAEWQCTLEPEGHTQANDEAWRSARAAEEEVAESTRLVSELETARGRAAERRRDELRERNEAAAAAQQAADAAQEAACQAYMADTTGRPAAVFYEGAERPKRRARARWQQLEARAAAHARAEAAEAERDERAQAARRRALAVLVAHKDAIGEEATDEERDAAAREQLERERRLEHEQRARAAAEAAAAHTAAQRQRVEAAQRAAREAREASARARSAARDATAGLAAGRRADAAAVERARQDAEHEGVEYAENMSDSARRAIESSPSLRLCMRHRAMEQERPRVFTAEGVPVGMERAERKNIRVAETKHMAGMLLALERQYGITHAYAVDGSEDSAEAAHGDETGAAATAWGSWDGHEVRGGALPPGTPNQIAELTAIERTLARHDAGDRIVILSDSAAAMALAETAWRGGELGRLAPTAGRMGGLLAEAITRHRLRIAERGEVSGEPGLVCLVWVKAHGGGVAPNAYADAGAKSHLAEEPQDVPLDLMLRRACVYAAGPVSHQGERGEGHAWMVSADMSLRKMIVSRLTELEVQRMRAESRTDGASPTLSHAHAHDRRVLAAMMHMQRRPGSEEAGTQADGWPTPTGRTMRMRTDDMGVASECLLCGCGAGHGGHVLECDALRGEAQQARKEIEAALRAAAQEATRVERAAPRTAQWKEWACGGDWAGGTHEAIGMAREARIDARAGQAAREAQQTSMGGASPDVGEVEEEGARTGTDGVADIAGAATCEAAGTGCTAEDDRLSDERSQGPADAGDDASAAGKVQGGVGEEADGRREVSAAERALRALLDDSSPGPRMRALSEQARDDVERSLSRGWMDEALIWRHVRKLEEPPGQATEECTANERSEAAGGEEAASVAGSFDDEPDSEWSAAEVADPGEEEAGAKDADAEDAETWATAGRRAEEEQYTMTARSGPADLRKVAWCTTLIARANRLAQDAARAAAAALGAGAAAVEEGVAAVGTTALAVAADAVGDAHIEAGQPVVEERDVGEAGIRETTLRYSQLRQVKNVQGAGVHIDTWSGEEGPWLRGARDNRAEQGGWSIHTRRGFRQGTGAAQRKGVQTLAVGPRGQVYRVAQPSVWPMQLEYSLHILGRAGQGTRVRIRLTGRPGGEVAVRVAAWATDAHGKTVQSHDVPYQAVEIPVDEGALPAARELFWVFGWRGSLAATRTASAQLEEAADGAREGGEAGWERIRRALGGELPAPTEAERRKACAERREQAETRQEAERAWEQSKERRHAATSEHAEAKRQAEAFARTNRDASARAAHADARVGALLRAAAHTLDVHVDAGRREVKKAYLKAALRHHPDKQGDAATFRAVQEAYEVLQRSGDAARAQARSAEGTTTGRGESACATEGAARVRYEAAERELRAAEEAEAEAMRCATEARDAQREPAWQRVAAHLQQGVDAYYKVWGKHRQRSRRRREQAAHALGYESWAAQRTAEAKHRAELARKARAEEGAAAMKALRSAERRVSTQRRTARKRAEDAMHQASSQWLQLALGEEHEAVARDYVVEIPWAAWCVERCSCKTPQCQHRDSERYEPYHICEVTGGGLHATAQRWRAAEVVLERVQAEKPVTGTTLNANWEKITAAWDVMTGERVFGTHRMAARVRLAGDSTSEDSTDSEAEATEQAEHQQAARRAREYMENARRAQRAADWTRRALATDGGRDDAAEAALDEEEIEEAANGNDGALRAAAARVVGAVEDADEEEWTHAHGEGDTSAADDNDGEAPGAGDGGTPAGTAGEATAERRRHTNPRAGARWWAGAWFGHLARAEYAEAWGGRYTRDPPPETHTASVRRAQESAIRAGRATGAATTREATRGAAVEARRRAALLGHATEDARATERRMEEVGEVSGKAKAWLAERRQLETQRGDAHRHSASAQQRLRAVSDKAANRLRRERPEANAGAEAARARMTRMVARVMQDNGMLEDGKEGEAGEDPGAQVAQRIGIAAGRAWVVRDTVRAVLEEWQLGPGEGHDAETRVAPMTNGEARTRQRAPEGAGEGDDEPQRRQLDMDAGEPTENEDDERHGEREIDRAQEGDECADESGAARDGEETRDDEARRTPASGGTAAAADGQAHGTASGATDGAASGAANGVADGEASRPGRAAEETTEGNAAATTTSSTTDVANAANDGAGDETSGGDGGETRAGGEAAAAATSGTARGEDGDEGARARKGKRKKKMGGNEQRRRKNS